MKLFRHYKNLLGYLHRFTLLQVGRLHIRIHNILTPDRTPFLHTHPFNYISVIISGGYVEEIGGKLITHRVGSIIVRHHSDYHRIHYVLPNTRTLFMTWNTNTEWSLKESQFTDDSWIEYEPGVYQRILYGQVKYSKFDVFWHRAHLTIDAARAECRPSIDQTTNPIQNNLIWK